MNLKTYFSILDWGRRYNRQTLTSDLIAAIIVTIMLIPQSLAYALSGVMMTLMGLFRLGFIANFLSHRVISGFITASGIIIATSQVGGLLGIKTEGHALPDLIMSIVSNIGQINLYTLAIGALVVSLLL